MLLALGLQQKHKEIFRGFLRLRGRGLVCIPET